jgi:galactokinase
VSTLSSRLSVWAPGRVNLIGEHIDYCGGTVLPMTLQFGTRIDIQSLDEPVLRVASANQRATAVISLVQPQRERIGDWTDFVAGVVALLFEAGVTLRGARVNITGNIPASGLSSSASLTCGLAYGLDRFCGGAMPRLSLARLAQAVEHQYVGVECGLMDQAAILLSEAGAALQFDCRSGDSCSIPVRSLQRLEGGDAVVVKQHARQPKGLGNEFHRSGEVAFVVIDSGKPRQLATVGYNQRLAEVRAIAAALDRSVASLARQPLTLLDHSNTLAQQLQQRLRHQLTEQARVEAAVDALRNADWTKLGQLFSESHASLRDDYQVSCEELDTLVDLVERHPGCLGARMTGAGFGGAIVALMEADAVSEAMAEASRGYAGRLGLATPSFIAEPGGGVRVVND